jgi:23S rRNA pseudouridine2605 synthase
VEEQAVRLQKVLAQAGLGSRRACEELIASGRVTVDGRPATLGQRVDPQVAVVRVDSERIAVAPGSVYLALNKPRGVLSAMTDDRGRPCVGDLIPPEGPRLFHVGRLDADTEGLLLLTNDGDLAHRLAHPSHGVPKLYLAEVPGPVAKDVGRRLREGVELDDGPAVADRFRVVASHGGRAQVELEVHEGRNHLVRRMLEAVGHPVSRLVRLRQGPVALGDLRAGRTRTLSRTEVAALYRAVGL